MYKSLTKNVAGFIWPGNCQTPLKFDVKNSGNVLSAAILWLFHVISFPEALPSPLNLNRTFISISPH